jgi:hypothetical protein
MKNIIDYYIITKQDLKLKMQDVRAYRGPNCGTDHKLLIAKILFPSMYTNEDKHEEEKNENSIIMVDKKKNTILKIYTMKVGNCYINKD